MQTYLRKSICVYIVKSLWMWITVVGANNAIYQGFPDGIPADFRGADFCKIVSPIDPQNDPLLLSSNSFTRISTDTRRDQTIIVPTEKVFRFRFV